MIVALLLSIVIPTLVALYLGGLEKRIAELERKSEGWSIYRNQQ